MMSEELWIRWTKIQGTSIRLMNKGELVSALKNVDDFFALLPVEEQGEMFAFRSLIKEKMGDLEGAEADLLAAYGSSEPATYHRYVLELSLGRLAEQRSDLPSAASWYLSAVKTAIEDPLTSGATAVESFLNLKSAELWSPAEQALCKKAIRQAWKLFSLPAEPGMEDLPGTLRQLSEAASRPLPVTQG